MRATILGLTAALAITGQAAAGQPAGPTAPQRPRVYTSAAEVQTLMAQAKAEHTNQANIGKNLLSLAPYTATLENRFSVGPAAVHENEAEIFYVVDGSGTLVTGGTLVNPTRTNAENISGTAVEGGVSQAVAKGDFIVVPEGTPHWYSQINGALILMSLHVPRGAAAAKP